MIVYRCYLFCGFPPIGYTLVGYVLEESGINILDVLALLAPLVVHTHGNLLRSLTNVRAGNNLRTVNEYLNGDAVEVERLSVYGNDRVLNEYSK